MEKKKSKAKIVLVTILIIIILLIIVLFITARIIIPKTVTKMVMEDKVPSFLPPEIKEQIKSAKESVYEFKAYIYQNKIDKDEVIDIINKSDNKKIVEYLKEIRTLEITSTDQLVDSASAYFDLGTLNIDDLKKDIRANVTRNDLRLMQNELNSTDLDSKAFLLSIPVLKTTAVEILKSE